MAKEEYGKNCKDYNCNDYNSMGFCNLDKTTAQEIFEYTHNIYGTKSVKETVNILNKLGLGKIVELALK